MFEWKVKELRWGKHASLMYDYRLLVEIEYTDTENYGVYSDCFSFLFMAVPYGQSFDALMDYVQGNIRGFCQDYIKWSK